MHNISYYGIGPISMQEAGPETGLETSVPTTQLMKGLMVPDWAPGPIDDGGGAGVRLGTSKAHF